jgi:hypothetical protein
MSKRRAQRGKSKGFTSSRIASHIGESHAFESKLLPAAERADSPKNLLFDVVARLEPGLAEFSHLLYQHLQSRRFFMILLLINDQWWKKVLVRPLGHLAQVDVEPSSGGAFPVAREGGLQVLLLMVVLIVSRGIEILEQAGVRRNTKPALAQHGEAVESRMTFRSR